MPKTQEELNALKEKELETESKKPRELTEEELAQVSGGDEEGLGHWIYGPDGMPLYTGY